MKEWRFVSNLNATDDGLNDAGIETFSADAEKSTVREVNQNSIDQISSIVKDNDQPVIVEFEDFFIQPDEFPERNQFEKILGQCISSSENDQVVKDFFTQAKKLMNEPIRVLRISDFNTTGLVGAESGEKGSPWYSLIKSKGSSNKNMSSGGSFGIGKSAPFACSNLRTVFYASKVDEVYSHIGVSRLISFQNENGMTIGTGYYSEDEKLCAILETFSFNGFIRSENGTDIYIMGFDGDADLENMIREVTLTNFFVSISKGLLNVKYKNLCINKDNVGQYIAALDEKKFADVKTYYELLNSTPSEENTEIRKIVLDCKEFGEKFGIQDGECTLLLMRGDDLNRRILMTRKPGMSLFLQSGINGSISFTGILLITGETMNEIFKSMEMPAHDSWEPKRCKVDRTKYIKAYEELRKYLRDKVVECFGQTQDEIIPAYGMEEFFDDVDESQGKVEINVLEGKARTSVNRIKNDSRKKNKVIAHDGIIDHNPEVQNPPGPDITNPPGPDITNPPGPDTKNHQKPKYKFVALKKRLLSKDEKNGKYVLKFKTDKKKKNIKLEFLGIGEQGNYPLILIDNAIVSANASVLEQKDNILEICNVPAQSDITIDFKIDFNRKCMMEVNYYEA